MPTQSSNSLKRKPTVLNVSWTIMIYRYSNALLEKYMLYTTQQLNTGNPKSVQTETKYELTSCSILCSFFTRASFSTTSLHAFCTASSSWRRRLLSLFMVFSFSLLLCLLSSRCCCRACTVELAALYRSGHSAWTDRTVDFTRIMCILAL